MASSFAVNPRKVVAAFIASAIGIVATVGIAFVSDPKIVVRDVAASVSTQVPADQVALRPAPRMGRFVGLFV